MTHIQTRQGRRLFAFLFATVLSLGLLFSSYLPFGGASSTVYANPLPCSVENNIIVSDASSGDQLQSFSRSTFGFGGTLLGSLSDPHDMKIGPDGNLYIADTGNGRIVRYDWNNPATPLVPNPPLPVGIVPYGLTFGADGYLYFTSTRIAAPAHGRVYRVNLTTNEFEVFIDTGIGGLNNPYEGIEFGPDGYLYVTSNNTAANGTGSGHHGVIRFNPIDLADNDIVLTSRGQFDDPDIIYGFEDLRDIAFGPNGYLYTSEVRWTDNQITYYTVDALGVGTVEGFFPALRPVGIAFSADGTELFVVEFAARQVHRYHPTSGASLGTFGIDTSTDPDTFHLAEPKAIVSIECLDWGDLPDGYPTLFANNGARHILDGTNYLGVCVDGETDGQPDLLAMGDDSSIVSTTSASSFTTSCAVDGDDEDGVQVCPGLGGSEAGNALGWSDGTVAGGSGGCLQLFITGSGTPQIFIDFDGDYTLNEVTLRNNDNSLITGSQSGLVTAYFDILDGTFPGTGVNVGLAVRVRLSTAGGLEATGLALDGEVEDYVFPFTPTAVSLSQNPTALPAASTTLPIIAFLLTGVTLLLLWRRPQVRTN